MACLAHKALHVEARIGRNHLIEQILRLTSSVRSNTDVWPPGTCARVLGGANAGVSPDGMKHTGQSPLVLKGVICRLLGSLLSFWGQPIQEELKESQAP